MGESEVKCSRIGLSTSTKRRLWADSGGFCQNPSCSIELFSADDNETDFAEMAHIISASTGGPRDVPTQKMTEDDRAHHTNVAVLCANCHTVVDKNPAGYSIELIRGWKEGHRERLLRALGTPIYASRKEAHAHVERLLVDNRTVFENYGPEPGNFSQARATQWARHVRGTVIPNNSELVRVLEANRDLLSNTEVRVLAESSLHAKELAARHILDDWSAGTSQFPVGMTEILGDE